MLTADGQSRRIDQIREGDQVVATDPGTGTTSTPTVAKVFVGEGDKKIVDIRIQGAEGTSVLRATARHKIWVPNHYGWFPAADLRSGMTLRTPDGRQVTVAGVETRIERAKVYNLWVPAVSTFYALAGTAPVLVHNDNICWDLSEAAIEQLEKDKVPDEVIEGIIHNVEEYNKGKTNHALDPNSPNTKALADYLTEMNKLNFTHTDGAPGGVQVMYDFGRGWLLVRRPGWRIHGYKYPEADWHLNAGTRYKPIKR